MTLRSVEGTYQDGKIELSERVDERGPVRVIVTFLSGNGAVDLAKRGITPDQAGNLRGRLRTFAEDWDRPDMDAYDAL